MREQAGNAAFLGRVQVCLRKDEGKEFLRGRPYRRRNDSFDRGSQNAGGWG